MGLVLYGGVSLAIYMNGISTELWNLLRASKARIDGRTDELDDTANLYAELLDELRELAGDDLRVVVDTIAGTSAGGVNGTVLAKAIVEGGNANILRDVWLNKADIAELRAEPAAQPGWWHRTVLRVLEIFFGPLRSIKSEVSRIPGVSWGWLRDHVYSMFFKPDGRFTLLDGDYFTEMIARTLADMGTGHALLPERTSFDLYLTRTDLHGWPRHLPVSRALHPDPLHERTHAHVMHFRRRPNTVHLDDDFGLTYATRSTAGFPIVFAPINYSGTMRSYLNERPIDPIPNPPNFARQHLPEHQLSQFRVDDAWMVDGGVLDNKPFSHVTQAIERKPAEHEVYRVVVYVEPDPEAIPEPPEDTIIPKPLQVGMNLYKLFRHEPIYEDLRRLRDRNARVTDIASVLEADVENARWAAQEAGRLAGLTYPAEPAETEQWKQATHAYAAKASLSGYPGYVVLKARSATGFLADVLCRALHFPYDSRHAHFMRRLVSRWVDSRGALASPGHQGSGGYVLDNEQRALLRAFDVPFRLRRLRALARATNRLYQQSRDTTRGRRTVLDQFKSNLEDVTLALDGLREDDRFVRETVSGTLGGSGPLSLMDDMIARNAYDVDPVIDAHGSQIKAVYGALTEHFREMCHRQNSKLAEALCGLHGAIGDKDVRPIMDALVTFPFVDITAFPLMAVAGIEDLIDVKVARISPLDTARKGCPPLRSLALGAFQGFLDRGAREHDMRLGRIDGSDRLIALLVAAAGVEGRQPQAANRLRASYLGKLRQKIDSSTDI